MPKHPVTAANPGWRSNLKYPFSLHCAGMLLGRQCFVPSMAMTMPEQFTGWVQLCHPSCQGSGVPLQPLSCPRAQMLPGPSGAGHKHLPSGVDAHWVPLLSPHLWVWMDVGLQSSLIPNTAQEQADSPSPSGAPFSRNQVWDAVFPLGIFSPPLHCDGAS